MTKHQIATLFDDHARTLYRYVYIRVGHQADAEDIISAVFEKVLKAHETYHEQPGATVRSWLFAITRTTIVDHFRKKGRDVAPIDDAEDIPSRASASDVLLDHHLDWSRVAESLAYLPDRQQEIVLLRYQSGLSNSEIAQMLDINQRTVASALSKAIAKLRKIFNSHL